MALSGKFSFPSSKPPAGTGSDGQDGSGNRLRPPAEGSHPLSGDPMAWLTACNGQPLTTMQSLFLAPLQELALQVENLLQDAATLVTADPTASGEPVPPRPEVALPLVDLVDPFEDLTACLMPTARRRRVAIHTDLPLASEPVAVDLPRLRTIVLLLLGEALSRMAPGRLLLRVRRKDGTMDDAADSLLHLHILGSLPPVSIPLPPRLTLCQQLAAGGGGRIHLPVETMGDGWQLFLPLGRSRPRSSPSSLSGRGRVLVVEDDETSRHLEAGLLQAHGWDVQAVADGAGALARLEETRFDLVVTDLRLPDLSGFQVVRHLRTRPSRVGATLPQVPVVGMSASVDAKDKSEGLAAGMSAVVLKPVGDPAFFALLDRLVPRTTATAAAKAPEPFPEAEAEPAGPVPPAGLVMPVDPEILDPEALQQYQETVGPGRLLQVLENFLLQTEDRLRTLSQHCAAAEREPAIRLAHAISGSAAQLGLRAFARAAAAWEAALRREKNVVSPEGLADLEAVWTATVEALGVYRQSLAALAEEEKT